MIFFNCQECEKFVKSKLSGKTKYCSWNCFQKSKKKQKKKNMHCCPECGEMFYRAPHDVTEKNEPYCSLKCWNIYQSKNKKHKECEICGKSFHVKEKRVNTAKYCSINCRNIFYRLFPPVERHNIDDNCMYCGKDIKIINCKRRKRNFCSRICSDLAHSDLMTGKRNPNYIDGQGGNLHPVEFNNRLKEKIRDRDKRSCQICHISEVENKKKLAVHHIDYNKSNQKECNLVSLCRICHSKTNGDRENWKLRLSKKLDVLI